MAGAGRKNWSTGGKDAPLRAAIAAAGGGRPFFRKLGLSSRPGWWTTPKARLFEVAEISQIPPEVLRPDLADWIAEERAHRALAASEGGASLTLVAGSLHQRWDTPVIDAGLTDLWASFAAVIWVARERGLSVAKVCYGRDDAAQEARAYAMALAHVAGRASSTNVGNVFRCSRQNVDNASERYLRARDGDDPEDHIQGQFPDGRARVLELGSNRLRFAKGADPALWAAEARFDTFLRGEDLSAAPPEPKRKRA